MVLEGQNFPAVHQMTSTCSCRAFCRALFHSSQIHIKTQCIRDNSLYHICPPILSNYNLLTVFQIQISFFFLFSFFLPTSNANQIQISISCCFTSSLPLLSSSHLESYTSFYSTTTISRTRQSPVSPLKDKVFPYYSTLRYSRL